MFIISSQVWSVAKRKVHLIRWKCTLTLALLYVKRMTKTHTKQHHKSNFNFFSVITSHFYSIPIWLLGNSIIPHMHCTQNKGIDMCRVARGTSLAMGNTHLRSSGKPINYRSWLSLSWGGQPTFQWLKRQELHTITYWRQKNGCIHKYTVYMWHCMKFLVKFIMWFCSITHTSMRSNAFGFGFGFKPETFAFKENPRCMVKIIINKLLVRLYYGNT